MINKEELKIEITTQELKGELSKTIEVIPPKTQEKECTPTLQTQEILPDEGFTGLSKVTVNSIPLESKSVTIKENTTTVIEPSETNGLSSVTVTTNVSGATPKTFEQLQNETRAITLNFLNYLDEISLSRNAYINNSVTLYTPEANFNKYAICVNASNYYVVCWFHENDFAWQNTRMGNLLCRGTFTYANYTNFSKQNGKFYCPNFEKFGLWMGEMGTRYKRYYSQSYPTIEEAITAIQSNSTTYNTVTSSYGYVGGTPIISNTTIPTGNDTTYIFNFENIQYVLSKNETIEIIS